jgi:hypothetical protein
VAAAVPEAITLDFLDSYCKAGPFGKQNNIGVLLQQSNQLKQLFHDIQIAHNRPPQLWIHNVATRWSSDYEMAARVLELWEPLEWLFETVEEQCSIEKTPEPEILSLKLPSMEWLTVQALQHILKRFAIANKQLQNDPASNNGRPTIGGFCEYIPVIKLC